MSDRTAHRARLFRWIGISVAIHVALLLVTSVGWFLGLGKAPEKAPDKATAPATAESKAPAAAPTDARPAPDALPSAPKPPNRDEAMFGPGERDPRKLQEGPDTRPDLDALK